MKVCLTKGKNLYDFYITPSLHIYSRYIGSTVIDVVWLKWFIGIEIWKGVR